MQVCHWKEFIQVNFWNRPRLVISLRFLFTFVWKDSNIFWRSTLECILCFYWHATTHMLSWQSKIELCTCYNLYKSVFFDFIIISYYETIDRNWAYDWLIDWLIDKEIKYLFSCMLQNNLLGVYSATTTRIMYFISILPRQQNKADRFPPET